MTNPYTPAVTKQVSIFTVANLNDQILRQFGDEANVQITATDIFRWTNMGLVEISRTNRVWEKTAQTQSVVPDFSTAVSNPDPAQYMMPLPDDCAMLQAIRYGGLMLPGFDFEQLMSQVGTDMNVKGTPYCYYMWAGSIGFYPYPDTAGVSIMIYYRGTPPFVSSLADVIPLPDQYFDTLTAYVMKKAYELDEDWTAQGIQQNTFDKQMNQLSEATDAYAGDFYTITDPIYEAPGGGNF